MVHGQTTVKGSVEGDDDGFSRRRKNKDGKYRCTAYYLDIRGEERSAGTYGTKKDADKAWHQAETKVAEGRAGDPVRGRQSFRRYVEDEWLPNHVIEASTREGYTYSLYAHIMDTFGPLRMTEILPSHVREWVADQSSRKLGPHTIRANKAILSAIFTTALNDRVTSLHPCKGVKIPPTPSKPLRIITPEEFDTFYDHLPDATSQLLVETAIETGMRWGELAELRRHDVDLPNRTITVSRVVLELNPRFHPEGGRFLVKDYPKDKEWRRIKVSNQIAGKLKAFTDDYKLGPDDLYFAYAPQDDDSSAPTPVEAADAVGLTEPNTKGLQYRHGTLSGYTAGKCRCPYCRRSMADYRAQRRTEGKDRPRSRPEVRRWETDGHIPRRWFRDSVLKPSLATSGIDVDVKMHGLRHAHASWLLSGGADLQVVKERLGHASILTTQKYLHTLPDADETALDAFAKIRQRSK